MNRLRDASSAVAMGFAVYGMLHLGASAEESAREHNAAVTECAQYLGGIAYQAEVVPDGGRDFAGRFKDPTLIFASDQYLVENHIKAYSIPARKDFVAEQFMTPEQVASRAESDENSYRGVSALLGMVIFCGLRLYNGLNQETYGTTSSQKTRQPRQPLQQLNEDSPQWLEYRNKT